MMPTTGEHSPCQETTSFEGDTEVDSVLNVGSATALSSQSKLKVNSGGTVKLNGFASTVASLESGPQGGGVIEGSASLTAGDENNASFSGILQDGTGALAFTKQGTGTQTLTGTNTYSGGTTVTAGILEIEGSGAINAAGALSIGADGTLCFNTSADQNLDGVITGSGDLVKQGTGQLTITGANSFTGKATIESGLVVLNSSATAITGDGDISTADVEVTGGTLRLDADNQLADDVDISISSGEFSLNGKTESIDGLSNSGGVFSTGIGGTLNVLGNTVTWSGGTNTINDAASLADTHWDVSGGANTVEGGTTGGTLHVESGGIGFEFTGSGTPNITLNSDNTAAGRMLLEGKLSVASGYTGTGATITSGGSESIAGYIDLGAGTRTFEINDSAAAASDLTISAVITNGGITKTGSGTLTLTSTNYTGGTTVSAGTLRLVNSASGNAILGGGHNYVVASGATLEFNRTAGTENISTFNLSGAGTFKTSGAAAIIQTSAGSTVAMGSGALFHVESGSYTFGAGGIGDWSSNLSDMQVDSGATFDGAATPTVVNALNGSGTVLTGGGITLGVDNGSGTFSGVIGNSSSGGSAKSITKAGSGTQTLSMGGFAAYSGTTTIDGGTLRFTNVFDLAGVSTTAFNINNGSTLEFESSVGGSNRTNLTGKTFTFGSDGGGTINFDGGNHLFQGGVHTFTTTGGLKNTISRTNGGFVNNQGSGNTVFNVADGSDDVDLEFSADWRNGTLTKSGAGTMAFTGPHSISKNIAIDAGTLEIGGSASLNGGTFTAAITNAGIFKHNSTANQTLSGVISGTGALVKDNTGGLTLSGANSYSGATTVTNGILALNNTTTSNTTIAGDANTVTFDVTINGGTLRNDTNEQIANNASITMSSGAYSLNGTTETIDAFTNSGGTFTTGTGTLIGLGNTITWSGGTNTINDGGTVQDTHWDVSGGTNTVQGGTTGGTLHVQSGGTGFEFTGTGAPTITLNSDNTAAGRMLLEGNLSVASSITGTATIETAGAGSIDGFIDMNGGTRTFTVNDGAPSIDLLITADITNGGLTKVGDGTLTLSGANTHTTTNIAISQGADAGTVSIENNSALGLGNVFFEAGGTVNLGVDGLVVNNNFLIYNRDSNNDRIIRLDLDGSNTGVLTGFFDIRKNVFAADVGADDTLTFSGQLRTGAGSGGLKKNGLGTLVLTNRSNSYSGGTTVNAGILSLNGANSTVSLIGDGTLTINAGAQVDAYVNAFGSTYQNAIVINGGILNSAAADSHINTVEMTGGQITGSQFNPHGDFTINASANQALISSNVSLAAANIDFNVGDGAQASDLLISGVISSGNGLSKSGAGTMTLSGANTYTGATTISAGTLQLGDGSTTGTLSASSAISVGSGATFAVNRSSAATQGTDFSSAAITGAGGFTQAGSGTTILNATNTYTGGTSVEAGTLQLVNSASGDAIRGSGHNYVVASGATLEFNRTGGTDNIHTFNLSGAGTFKTSGAAAIIQTSAGSTVAMGSGALFHVESGSYTFGAAGIGDWSSNLSDMQVDSGATFDGAATPTVVNALNGSGTVLTGGGITLGVDNGSGTFSGVIGNSADGGSAFSITKEGAGTQTLTGTNTYTGGTTVSAGTLQLVSSASGNAIRGGGHNYVVASGATLEFNRTAGTDSISTFNLSGAGTFKTSGTAPMAQTSAGSTVAMGSGALFHVESGSYTFGAAGIGSWSSNLSDMQVDSGATFDGAATPTVIDALNGSGTVLTGGGITLGVDNGTGTFSGVIGNASFGSAFSITKAGAGTQTLSGANTYTGGTTVSAGTLQISGAGSLSTSSAVVNNANLIYGTTTASDTYGLSSSTTGTGTLTGTAQLMQLNGDITQGTVNLTSGTNGSLYEKGIELVADTTITAGSITLTGDLGRSGSSSGNLALDTSATNGAINLDVSIGRSSDWYGFNSFTADAGTGTLTVSGANAASGGWRGTSSASLTGTLNISSSFSLSGTGAGNLDLTATGNSSVTGDLALANTTNTWTVNPGLTMDVSGVISGTSAAITKNGTGTLTLSGANSYTGSTTLSAGTLVLGNASGAGTGTITQTDGTSTLRLNTTGTITNDISLFNLESMESVTLSGAITANNATYDIASGTTTTISGDISGGGGTTKIGLGTLVLEGTNTYAGITNINEGTLLINGSNAGATEAYTIGITDGDLADAATLGGTGSIGGATTLTNTGFLSAGDGGVGTLSFLSSLDVVNASTGSLLFDLGSAGTGDLIDVTGNLNIGNGLLDLDDFVFTNLGATSVPGTYTWNLFQATSGDILGSNWELQYHEHTLGEHHSQRRFAISGGLWCS